MKTLRSSILNLLLMSTPTSSRRSSPQEGPTSRVLCRKPVTTAFEDRTLFRDEVSITEGAARMPDRPRGSHARCSASPLKSAESPGADEDYSMEVSSGSSSKTRSRKYVEPNSASRSTGGPGPSHRDSRSVVSLLTPELRRERVSEAVMETAREPSQKLSDAESEYYVEKAIGLVRDFAFGTIEPTRMLERQDALNEAGALEKLVDAVGDFMGNNGIVAAVLSSFRGLRTDEGIGLHVGMMRTVETVVVALRAYGGDARVVREGLRLLSGLTRVEDVRTRLLSRHGAIKGVIDCLQRHPRDEALQTEGARFLSYASTYSETYKTELAKSGGLGRVMNAARDLRESRALCANMCTGLRNITVRRPDIVKVALGLGAVAGLLEILSGHGDAYITATEALAGLFHMTGCEAGIREVLRHEGWDSALFECIRLHVSRPSVQALC